jgi:hypothetical protein
MVEIVSGSVVGSSYGDSEVTSGDLTIADLALQEGDRFYILYHYRNVQNISIEAPSWNGQVAAEVVTSFDNNGLYRVQLYCIVAESAATANLTSVVDGDNAPSQFTFLVSTRFIVRGEVALTPHEQIQTESVLTVAGYTTPEFSFTDLESGDMVISLLATTAFDGDFNVEAATWSASNLDDLSTVTHSTSNYSKIQELGVAEDTTGSLTVGWTPSVGEPGWSHIGFVIKSAPSSALVDINGDDIVVIGSAENTLNTLGIEVAFNSL